MKKLIYIFLVFLCVSLAGCQSSRIASNVSYADVDQTNAEALQAFDKGDYSGALLKYTDAMKDNPIDMNAMIGAIRCQIALENYDMAATNLSAAINVNPQLPEIYDLYIALSEASEQIGYARTAVSLATQNNVESFLSRVPTSPVLNYPEGKYDERFQVEISAEPGTEIFVIEKKDSYHDSYQYFDSIPITRGDTSLKVYCIKDGIPSETTEAHYICDYPPTEVKFVDSTIERMVRLELGNESGPITDVDCEGITELRQYDLRNAGMDWREYENIKVKSIEDLRLFPNLQRLYLENAAPINDYSPLSSCRRLRSLQMDDCGLTNISFVKYIPSLGYFSVSDNQISDLTPLSKCTNLYNLTIDGNPVKDISILSELDIEDLSITASNIEDLSVLRNWEDMRYLYMYGCGGLDLSPLAAMTNLESLYLYAEDYTLNNYWEGREPLGDLSFLQNFEGLERLCLQGLSDYSALNYVKSLGNLTYLYARTLNYDSIPSDLLQELQTALPGCSIS